MYVTIRLANNTTDTQAADAFKICDTMEGVTAPVNEEVNTLTLYTNDACDQVDVRSNGSIRPSELYTDDLVITDVKDYFSRPKLITSFNVPAGRVLITSVLLNNSFLQSYFYNFDRLRGAYGYRCTLCFRVQLAAQPFLAGRLRLAFQPYYSSVDTPNLHNRFTSAPAICMLPGVELDYTEQTSVVLKVPYIHPLGYFPVSLNTADNYGTLGLYSYLPISRSSSSPYPTGSIYMWAEDFEIISAAGVPTSVAFPVATTSVMVSEPIIEAQSGKMATTAKEEKAVPGTLSKILGAGSSMAMVLSGLAPSLTSIAGPTSWALREMSNIAASYGWSKPIDASPVSKIYRSSNTNQFNCDGTDNSHNLGMFSENAVQTYPGFAGTDIDEMSFKYILSKPGLLYNGTILSTNVIGTNVYICDLAPTAMFYQSTFNRTFTPSLLAYWPTPIFGLANGFSFYRGGFKFKIKLAKTKLHTGRLLVGFQPQRPGVATSFTLPADTLAFNYKSLVWDLREGNELEFECPFISPLPYLDIDASYGTFFMQVIEPFSGPSTCGLNCPFAIEVSAMDDFELAAPSTFTSVPAPLTLPIYAQSGTFQPYSTNKSGGLAEFCIGEKINSIKQLLTKAAYQETIIGSVQQSYNCYITLPTYTGTSVTSNISTPYQYFYYAYALNRGGANYDFMPITKDTTITVWPFATGITPGPVNRPVVTEYDNALHVKRPFYSKVTRRINDGVETLDRAVFAGVYSTETDPRTLFYSRMSDDFQFGYFIGFPPMCAPTLTSQYDTDFYAAIATGA